MQKRRTRIPLAVVLAVAMLAVGVTGCQQQEDPNANTIVIAVHGDLDGTDIQQVHTSNVVQDFLNPAPVVFDLAMENLVPQVAEAISFSEDGLSIFLEFSSDLKFPDGRAATGEDVKASIDRYIEISPYNSDWGELDRTDVDGQKVTLVFKTPPAYFFAVLASTYSGIVDVQKAAEVGDEAFNREGVGIGPFMLEENGWVQGSHFSFVRNPHYQDHKPFVDNKGPVHLEKATVRVIPESITRVSELEAGTVDVAYSIDSEHYQRIRDNDDLELITYAGAGQTYLRINSDREPMNDLRFREAINYAIDKDNLKTALDNAVEPVYGLLSPAQLAYSDETESELMAERGHDVARANTLLDELGYLDGDGDGIREKDGEPIKLVMVSTNNVAVQNKSAPVLQNQLKAVGIDVELQQQGRQYVRELVRAGDYDLALQAWSWTDPDIWYYSFHSSSTNPMWTMPEMDEILDTGRTMIDIGERTAKYAELSRLNAEFVPMVPLFYSIGGIGVRKSVTGIQISKTGTIYWNDVRK